MDAFQKLQQQQRNSTAGRIYLPSLEYGTSFRFLEFKRDTDKMSRETFYKHKEIAYMKKDREGTGSVR
jgi:hypothetical protein